MFYASVRDNYDPRSNGGMMEQNGEVVQLEQLVRQATKRAEYQSRDWQTDSASAKQHESSSAQAKVSPGNLQRRAKVIYPKSHRYNQSNHRHNQFRQHKYSHHQEGQFYLNQSDQCYNRLQGIASEDAGFNSSQPREFDTVMVADLQTGWEQVCETLGQIYRRPDLQHKLAGAKLELVNQEKKVAVRLVGGTIDARSLLGEDRALIQLAFSQRVARSYVVEFC